MMPVTTSTYEYMALKLGAAQMKATMKLKLSPKDKMLVFVAYKGIAISCCGVAWQVKKEISSPKIPSFQAFVGMKE